VGVSSRRVVLPGVLAALALALLSLSQGTRPALVEARSQKPADTLPDAAFHDVVAKQCTKCHVEPLPEYLPRGMWRLRIQEMAERSLTGTGLVPGEESTLWQLDLTDFNRYFEARAPETLPAPEPWPPIEPEGKVRFVRHPWNPAESIPVPVVANVRFLDLDGDGHLEIVVCDMGHGLVLVGDPARAPGVLREIARVPNPDHAEMVDLDGDGRRDLLIADLGDFLPADHEKGSVVWLRQTSPGVFEQHVLIGRLPRVADVEAADFDGDGDLDLVVACFGWHKVGGTFFYENKTTDWSRPVFEGFPVDARPGPIHVPPVDLNGDGRPDFVCLLSQQYERVLAFINRRRGGFRMETLFQAPSPAWGSSGLQVTDLDADGDPDVLVTNGDTLDDATVKPYHGIRWLENEGEFPFARHDLAAMPGVHRAQAADLDGDGDLDIVACAFLPDPKGERRYLASIGWLEQTSRRVFERHTLEVGKLSHTTLDLGDYDGDGDVDLLVGNMIGFTFAKTETGFHSDTWVELWENVGTGGQAPAKP
jgi:hypothetical protein